VSRCRYPPGRAFSKRFFLWRVVDKELNQTQGKGVQMSNPMEPDNRDEVLGRMLEMHEEERHQIHQGMPEILIIPGQEIFVEAEINRVNARVKTFLVGGMRGDFLIIMAPRVNGQIIPLKEQREIVIRYIQEGAVYGFASKVQRSIGQPFNLAIIQYPSAIEEVSLRRSPRIPVVIPVERDGVQRKGEMIVNLSAGGAAVLLNQMVQMEDTFNLSFTLPNGTFIRDMAVKVMRIEASSGKIVAGVAFDERSGQGKQAVCEYLKLVQLTVNCRGDGFR